MIIWIAVCVILALIILIQKGKGGGLSGAFGGAGSGAGLLGTKTGDFLTWVTISLVGAFFLLAIIMGIFLTGDNTAPPAAISAPPTQTATPVETTPAAPADTQTPLPAETGDNADNTNTNENEN